MLTSNSGHKIIFDQAFLNQVILPLESGPVKAC